MNTTTRSEELGRQIGRLVELHLSAVRSEALEALEKAFGGAPSAPASRPRKRPAGPRQPERRRTPDEIAELGGRLYEALSAHPGESMADLAGAMDLSPRELHRPMAQLKRDGRVRSVGQRHLTRYFPMAASAEPG